MFSVRNLSDAKQNIMSVSSNSPVTLISFPIVLIVLGGALPIPGTGLNLTLLGGGVLVVLAEVVVVLVVEVMEVMEVRAMRVV